jgi:hypothetical protein
MIRHPDLVAAALGQLFASSRSHPCARRNASVYSASRNGARERRAVLDPRCNRLVRHTEGAVCKTLWP